MTSTLNSTPARGGNMNVPRARYSFSTSFCSSTLKSCGLNPLTSAAATNSATAIGPMAFAVVRIWLT
jgi:hypothetical protein